MSEPAVSQEQFLAILRGEPVGKVGVTARRRLIDTLAQAAGARRFHGRADRTPNFASEAERLRRQLAVMLGQRPAG